MATAWDGHFRKWKTAFAIHTAKIFVKENKPSTIRQCIYLWSQCCCTSVYCWPAAPNQSPQRQWRVWRAGDKYHSDPGISQSTCFSFFLSAGTLFTLSSNCFVLYMSKLPFLFPICTQAAIITHSNTSHHPHFWSKTWEYDLVESVMLHGGPVVILEINSCLEISPIFLQQLQWHRLVIKAKWNGQEAYLPSTVPPVAGLSPSTRSASATMMTKLVSYR